ncbi:hypothetical protein [Achromobacter marplatensis]|uniref:hypothetical protein n=1 Tax=Achromobacter marplatensis TaxID=470868 RepID=UPI003CFFB8DE
MFRYFISLMYNPAVYADAQVYEPLGFRNGNAMRTRCGRIRRARPSTSNGSSVAPPTSPNRGW